MAESPAVSTRRDTTATTPRRRQIPILAIVLAISIAANIALASVLILSRTSNKSISSYNKDSWYGVFVNNNEAFVGHILAVDGENITMKDIWYLTASVNTDPATGRPYENPKPDQITVSVNQLGSTNIYGPKDQVQFNRANMRYYTELRNDSPVVAKIITCEQQGKDCPKQSASPPSR